MKKRSVLSMKLLIVLSLLISLLSGCGSPGDLSKSYPLESVNKEGTATSYVYRAVGQTVPEVAKDLTDDRKPDQISPEDPERMFLVYDKEWYHLQQDPVKKEDTLIEVDSKEYVQKNYDSSFLQGYIAASIIGNLFDSVGRSGGSYRGYSSKDVYQPKQGSYRQATVNDKKISPPLTVEKKGAITRRGTSNSSTTNGKDDTIFSRGANDSTTSKGTIKRGSSEGGSSIFGSSSSSSNSKKSISKPKTRSGSGKISRRSKRR
ncbi:DUF4247 domain-containing protein [Paenibacillus macquariensis]|uniref:DUF4247 domain-containing protein n=1 Tax=Paenibacillus macquariensis TaxID=948756 RepID=A0ABY1K7W2_9BACL|nr:DUF4247 domain-containing protein [Paenibacillus macquariensis]MEC0091152.1 DUF4247 domain-containing protein [Paenibacillus macquariensis]OAB33664.1 hypothetical protein PMSM_13640 [Paenibacillus macquariensis subsp. macquariensis]SIR38263.1 protein of unknown function [Paenibacillus macquariensis]